MEISIIFKKRYLLTVQYHTPSYRFQLQVCSVRYFGGSIYPMLYRYSSVAQSLDISESSEGAQQFGIAWVLHVLHRAQNMDFRPSNILLDDVTWKLVVGVPTSLTGSLQTISG